MKPRLAASPDFIRETRRLIRAAGGRRGPVMIRARHAWNGGWGALLFAAFLVAMPAVLHAPDSHVGNPGDVLLLLGVLLGARGWIRADHAHHLPLAFWPADEDAAVRRLGRASVVKWAWTCGWLGLGHALAAAQASRYERPLLAVLQGAAFALVLGGLGVVETWAAWRWKLVRRYLAALLLAALGFLAAAAFAEGLRPSMKALLSEHGDVLAALAPAGWLVLPWSAWVQGGPWFNAWFLLPLGLALLALPRAFLAILAAGRFRDRVLFEWFGQIPVGASPEFGDAVHDALVGIQSAHAPGPTANADAILDRAFLASPLASAERLRDRWAWRWWTPAQRVLAECMARAWPRTGRHRIVGLLAIPVGWLGTWMAARTSFEGTILAAAVVPHVIAVTLLVPWLSPFQSIALVRILPVRLLDAAWLRWKHTVLRTLLPGVVLSLGGAVTMGIAREPAWVGAVVGLQVALAPAVVSPFATVYGLVNGQRTKGFVGLLCILGIAAGAFLNIAGLLTLPIPFLGLGSEAFCLGLNLALLGLVNRLHHRLRLQGAPVAQGG